MRPFFGFLWLLLTAVIAGAAAVIGYQAGIGGAGGAAAATAVPAAGAAFAGFGLLGLAGIVFFALFVFFAVSTMARMAFHMGGRHSRWGGRGPLSGGGHGAWHGNWQGSWKEGELPPPVEERLRDWHQRAHQETVQA